MQYEEYGFLNISDLWKFESWVEDIAKITKTYFSEPYYVVGFETQNIDKCYDIALEVNKNFKSF